MSEVLIVGAGPTGLTLAIELIKRGIDIRIIDQAAQPSIYSKALGLQARTLEIFEQMGIVDQFLQQGLKIYRANYHHDSQSCGLNFNFPEYTSYPYILVVPQSETERILNQTLEDLGKKVERSINLKTIIPDECVILQHPDGNEEIVYPQWIIGCDGAHSTVRHVMNIPFQGSEFLEAFVLVDAELSTTLPQDQMHAFFNSKGACAIFPLPSPNHFRLILPFKRNIHLDKNMLELDFFQRIINERIQGFTVRIKSIQWSSLFYIHRNIVPHMRYRNVFLAGDAAHIHSPAGGQGLNTSVQDAQNLAWKLALVMHGYGRISLLDSYEKERLPVARQVLDGTTKATKMITFFQKRWSKFLFTILCWAFKRPIFTRKLTMAISELGINYYTSPIVHRSVSNYFWKGPDAGYLAPDVLINDKKRLHQQLQELKHVLLFFIEDVSHPFIEKIERHYSKWIKLVTISKSQTGTINDEENNIHRVYNAQRGTVYLIRPDGYIAYRSRKLNEKQFFNYLEKIIKI